MPLLDEAAELIGPDVATLTAAQARAAEASRDRTEALEFARKVLEQTGEAYPNMAPTAEMLADRFGRGRAEQHARRPRPRGPHVDLRARGGRRGAGAVADAVATDRPPRARAVDDGRRRRRADGSAAGATAWGDVLDGIAEGRWRLEELTVNYRTPAEVMDLATALLEAHGIAVKPARSARSATWPPSAVRLTGREPAVVAGAAAAAVRADDELYGGGRHAVVVPREGYRGLSGDVRALLARDPGDLAARVDVLTVDEVKGLEFDGVTVVDPQAVVDGSPRGVNDLYVALTRPTQRLTVLHHGNLPPGLDRLLD